jgi:hypothetical protein
MKHAEHNLRKEKNKGNQKQAKRQLQKQNVTPNYAVKSIKWALWDV